MKKNRFKILFRFNLLLWPLLALSSCDKLVVLDSKGAVGREEAFLIYFTIAIMTLIALSVFVLAFWFARRYKASNNPADYQPKWEGTLQIELAIWLVPIAIIIIFSYLTWTRTIQLDPYKAITAENKPLNIEVVSMDWNWLFIYPDYNIASVNEVVFPVHTPLQFRLTSASVMTSFFIPQLGSQMYAMAGMQTRLNLIADETGVYEGHNQEFSGRGYVTMYFNAIAKSSEGFNAWVDSIRQNPDTLSLARFAILRQPDNSHPLTTWSAAAPALFDHILNMPKGWMKTHGGAGRTDNDSLAVDPPSSKTTAKKKQEKQ